MYIDILIYKDEYTYTQSVTPECAALLFLYSMAIAIGPSQALVHVEACTRIHTCICIYIYTYILYIYKFIQVHTPIVPYPLFLEMWIYPYGSICLHMLHGMHIPLAWGAHPGDHTIWREGDRGSWELGHMCICIYICE